MTAFRSTASNPIDGPRDLRFPKLGELRAHEHTGKLAKMLKAGRFHVYAASFRFERGRWVVAITGVAAQLHHQRRSPKNRHPASVGVDLGVKTLAVVADEHGRVLHVGGGESTAARPGAPEAGQPVLLENQEGLRWPEKAARRLGKIHARVAHLRGNLLHNITTELARGYTCVTIEDPWLWSRTGGSRRPRPAPGAGPSTRP